MASFADYTTFVEPLRLPYRGKVYEIPPVGIEDEIRLRLGLDAALAAGAGEDFDPEHELDADEFDRILLGTALDEMKADNVPADFVQRVLKAAMGDFHLGRDYAQAVWDTDGSPKALAEWIRTHKVSEPSNGTGEGNETPTPASTSGTRTSRAKPKPSTAGKAATGSRRGASSSPSGSSSKRTSTPSTASTSTPKAPSGE